jgi:hypothetical protein
MKIYDCSDEHIEKMLTIAHRQRVHHVHEHGNMSAILEVLVGLGLPSYFFPFQPVAIQSALQRHFPEDYNKFTTDVKTKYQSWIERHAGDCASDKLGYVGSQVFFAWIFNFIGVSSSQNKEYDVERLEWAHKNFYVLALSNCVGSGHNLLLMNEYDAVQKLMEDRFDDSVTFNRFKAGLVLWDLILSKQANSEEKAYVIPVMLDMLQPNIKDESPAAAGASSSTRSEGLPLTEENLRLIVKLMYGLLLNISFDGEGKIATVREIYTFFRSFNKKTYTNMRAPACEESLKTMQDKLRKGHSYMLMLKSDGELMRRLSSEAFKK